MCARVFEERHKTKKDHHITISLESISLWVKSAYKELIGLKVQS